jgi:formylglycine-generating enzyme required for sulfatase activity
MSDDLHDVIEDGIRDNAGHMALAGILMAHSQRKQQLQSFEASRQQQAKIARTEAERLEVEKQRLKIEKLRHQIEKDIKESERVEKEAVRLLRVMMAEIGVEFDGLSSGGQLKGSPQGTRRNYAMAVLLSKLILIRSRSSSLSDLDDLKELARLENLAQNLVIQQFANCDPLEVSRSKWQEIEAWMQAAYQLKKEVNRACSVVPNLTAVQLPTKVDLSQRHSELEDFLKQINVRLKLHLNQLPVDTSNDGCVYEELVELAQLDEMREGKRASRSAVFATRWRQANESILRELNASLMRLQNWQDKHDEHAKILQKLQTQIEQGALKGAEITLNSLGKLRFSGLNYDVIWRLSELQESCKNLALASRDQALMIIDDLQKQHSKASESSELKTLLKTHQHRACQEKRDSFRRGIFSFGISTILDRGKDQAFQKRLTSQRELAFKLKTTQIGAKIKVSIIPNLGLEFCFIPSGSFRMGSSAKEKGRSTNKKQVGVILSMPFWLAKTQLTQMQWQAVMSSNPSEFRGPSLPVENVSWEDAQACLIKLNEKGILPEAWKFALPTEAQWEYACRAGKKEPHSGGSLDEVGWYDGNSDRKTHEVALKKPNAWGLHDMHGNVWEWCVDRYDDVLQGGTDPAGPSSGVSRVCRGGSWSAITSSCSATSRNWHGPDYHTSRLGFRLAIVPSK